MRYLGFDFVPEDRAGLLGALAAHPSAARLRAPDQFRLAVEGSACTVELGDHHGTLAFAPGEGDRAADLAQELLTDAGAVFAGCC